MLPESRQLIHAGINFLLAPPPSLEPDSRWAFLKALEGRGIPIQSSQFLPQELVVGSQTPSQFEIKIASLSQAPVGQLLMIASQPSALEVAKDQVNAAAHAFKEAWPMTHRQFVQCDVTIRALFETTKEHAFMELWEARLGQEAKDLNVLGRPVLGGGIRFVMPATNPMEEARDIKIESFLIDTKKIFIEAQFTWQTGEAVGADFRAGERLAEVSNYIQKDLVTFMRG